MASIQSDPVGTAMGHTADLVDDIIDALNFIRENLPFCAPAITTEDYINIQLTSLDRIRDLCSTMDALNTENYSDETLVRFHKIAIDLEKIYIGLETIKVSIEDIKLESGDLERIYKRLETMKIFIENMEGL